MLGGAVAENHDLQSLLSAKTALVIGVVLVLGFLLLLFALQAPLLAAAGVLTNLLATGAAFGVSKWIFQDGDLHSLLGFQPQGFLDAWGPVFFFAMIFAISMDYTMFLLSSAKEHWDHSHNAKDAMVSGIAHSGSGDLRRRRGDGRRVLHLRALRAAAAEGDGDHPRRRRAARRGARPAAAAPGAAAPDGRPRLVSAQVGAARSSPTSASDTPESMQRREAMEWDAGKACMLDAPERERDMPAGKVADLLALAGSETIIDYGAGTGRLALAVAERLRPEGSVIAIEDSEEMFELLSQRLAGIPCAEALLIEGDHVPLPDQQADRVLAVDVLHHVRPDTLSEMRRLLTRDGQLLLIDWERGHPREDGPPDDVLLTAGEAIQELAAAGLKAHRVDAPFVDRYTPVADGDQR